jgi:hypothetical protein
LGKATALSLFFMSFVLVSFAVKMLLHEHPSHPEKTPERSIQRGHIYTPGPELRQLNALKLLIIRPLACRLLAIDDVLVFPAAAEADAMGMFRFHGTPLFCSIRRSAPRSRSACASMPPVIAASPFALLHDLQLARFVEGGADGARGDDTRRI